MPEALITICALATIGAPLALLAVLAIASLAQRPLGESVTAWLARGAFAVALGCILVVLLGVATSETQSVRIVAGTWFRAAALTRRA